MDMRGVAAADVPMLSLAGQLFLSMGTAKEDFVKLAQRIGRKTGGLRGSNLNGIVRGSGDTASWMFLRGKATLAQVDDLSLRSWPMSLLTAKLDNRERFLPDCAREQSRAGIRAGAGWAPGRGHPLARAL